MTRIGGLTRRSFVRMAAIASLAAQSVGSSAASVITPSDPWQTRRPRFAFVGAIHDAHPQGVSVFELRQGQWNPQQFAASPAPVALALHPSGKTLYVLNGISQYQGLPAGSVEAWSIEPATGQLTLLNREGLSLSGTHPRHLAISPDGTRLVIAIDGGGAYNLFPVRSDGRLGRVCGIIKQAGSGPVLEHQGSAHPQAVLFDPSGDYVLATDLGADRLSVFTVKDGLSISSRHSMLAGSGPQHLAMHPSGHLLYVTHALNRTLSCFAYDAGTMHSRPRQVYSVSANALAIHPSGDTLYTAASGEIAAWSLDAVSGQLHPGPTIHSSQLAIRALHPLADGSRLLALDAEGVLAMPTRPTGSAPRAIRAARLPGARCIAIL